MRRRLAMAMIIAALAPPALGQERQPASPQRNGPSADIKPNGPSTEAGREKLPVPAEAPPAPALLNPAARPAQPAEAAAPAPSAIPLPAGMQDIATGGWRVLLAPNARDIPAGLRPTLQQIARRLALTTGRVTIIAQAPAPALEPSFARRLSLERGLAMKAILVAGGLEATRIDIRPMGRQPNGVDVVDILPPGAAR